MALKEHLAVEALAGYPPEIGRWLWALEDTRRQTKDCLEGIQPTVMDWVAHEGGNSIGTLLFHLVAIEMDWLYTEVLEEKDFPPQVEALLPYDVRDGQGQLMAVRGIRLEEHLRRLEATRAIFLDAFRPLTTGEFRRLRSFEAYEVTPEWVLHHLIQHEAEHRGQIGELRASAEQALHINQTRP